MWKLTDLSKCVYDVQLAVLKSQRGVCLREQTVLPGKRAWWIMRDQDGDDCVCVLESVCLMLNKRARCSLFVSVRV